MIERLLGSDDQCRHHDEFTLPKEDDGVWYLLDEERRRQYWCEQDAVYIKLESISRDWICTGCGKEKTIESAEVLGGEENLKRKSEMSEEELERFRDEVTCGSFLNGFPEHREVSFDD